MRLPLWGRYRLPSLQVPGPLGKGRSDGRDCRCGTDGGSGRLHLTQRRNCAIRGGLSAGLPWPSMLCSRCRLPSLQMPEPWVAETERRAGLPLRNRWRLRAPAPYAKTQPRHPWRAQRGPSLARDALLQVQAPLASDAGAVGGRNGAKGGIAAAEPVAAQGACTLRKDATAPSVAGSARAFPGPRCFAPGAGSPRFRCRSRRGRDGAMGGIAAVEPVAAQGACTLRKDATAPSVAGSARAFPGPRCFAPGADSPRFTYLSRGRQIRCLV